MTPNTHTRAISQPPQAKILPPHSHTEILLIPLTQNGKHDKFYLNFPLKRQIFVGSLKIAKIWSLSTQNHEKNPNVSFNLSFSSFSLFGPM